MRKAESVAYSLIPKQQRSKFRDKAKQGIFVGYDMGSRRYRAYAGHKNIVVCRTIRFLEHQRNLAIGNDKTEEKGLEHLLTPCSQTMTSEPRPTDSESIALEQIALLAE